MVTQGLPTGQFVVEGIIGDVPRPQVYVPDYTVEAATDLLIVRITTDQYAGALHAASLDRHLRAGSGGNDSDVSCGNAGELPSDAPTSPLVEYTSRNQLLDGDDTTPTAAVAANNVVVSMETKSCCDV